MTFFPLSQRFTHLGGKLPKGVLLAGPPGTGNTMLARVIAGEAGVPFFSCSGSEFEEICYWRKTKCKGPNVHEDDVKSVTGRFDHNVVVPNPDVKGRQQILESHMSKVLKVDDVDLMIIARVTPGFSGADLANLINIAAIKAAMDGAKAVSMADLEHARDKIRMGSERKSAVISEESRKLTAFHEGGHALVAIHTDGAFPVHKATVVPSGMALGMVTQLPDKDQTSISRKQMLADLDVCMGENEVTSGASSDLREATSLAREMVTEYGMGNEVGLVTHDYEDDGRSMSSETRLLVEKEVKQT
ncbi:hypothetical protein JHK84_039711 [Glycine max]|nr:hypothetical protein JHK84_039711 [Glycine max]